MGAAPGATKVARALELGIKQLTEAQLRKQLGLEAGAKAPAAVVTASSGPAAPAPKTGSGKEKAAKLIAELKPSAALITSAEKMVGPEHFRDLGLTESELWGFVTGCQRTRVR